MIKDNFLNTLPIKAFVVGSLLLFIVNNVFGQDPAFSQFYANPLYLNPAFAGTVHCPRVSMNQRTQWANISGSFVTSSASYDQHVNALAGGIGVIVTDDLAGEGNLRTTNVSGIYSYQIPVVPRKFWIQAGLKATWGQKKLNDWNNLTFQDMIDPRRGFVYQTQEVPRDQATNFVDFSAGILGFSEKYFVGFAVDHLTEPDESVVQGISPLPRKFTFHAGAVLPVASKGSEASLSPNLLVQMQDNFLQINVGTYFTKGPIVAGLWYRGAQNADAVIALLGFETGILKFGYSYDITLSEISDGGGSHEFSLGLQFNCKPKPTRFRTINCPSF